MKTLVTGATGFVGSHLVDQLLAAGHEVTALVRSPDRAAGMARQGVQLVKGDLADTVAIERAMVDQEVVHHVAALTGALNEAEFMAANRDGTELLVHAAAAAGVKRFVYVSSGAAGGPNERGKPMDSWRPARPVTMYGRSKLAGEAVVQACELPWTIIRPPSVYGPRDIVNFLSVFRAAKRLGIVPVFGDGQQELSIIHVEDLADACRAAAESENAIGKIYYVNHPIAITSRELVSAIGDAAGRTPKVLGLPEWLTRAALTLTGGWAAIRGQRTILRPDKANEFFQEAWTGDPTEFMTDTRWRARNDLKPGLEATAAWYREQGLI